MTFRAYSIACENNQGSHALNYYEWGAADNPRVLFCVHGLARQGRDFDYLAQAMSDEYRVVCPDMPGRGRSGWLAEKMQYGYPQYLQDINALIAHVQPGELHWLGTSMGGMIGMLLAAQPDSPIRSLVLNDIGAVLDAATVTYLQAWFGTPEHFADMAAAEAYCRRIYPGFGALNDQEWRELAVNTVRPCAGGGYELHYDPGIAEPVRQLEPVDYAAWEVWDAIRCPVLLLHGLESIVLSRETVAHMRGRGPRLEVVEFAGVGHAPTLTRASQIAPVREFLLRKCAHGSIPSAVGRVG